MPGWCAESRGRLWGASHHGTPAPCRDGSTCRDLFSLPCPLAAWLAPGRMERGGGERREEESTLMVY